MAAFKLNFQFLHLHIPYSRSSDSHPCGPAKLAGSSSKSWRKISLELQHSVTTIKRTRGKHSANHRVGALSAAPEMTVSKLFPNGSLRCFARFSTGPSPVT